MVLKNEYDMGLFNKDFEYLFLCNRVEVTLINPNPLSQEAKKSNLLGIESNDYEDVKTLVYISADSTANRIKRLEKLGYVSEGKVIYICMALKDLDITNKSRISFKDGRTFRCEMRTQGEYEVENKTFLEFDLVRD